MLPHSIKKFIELFAKLPGIGPRQASRIAFWLIRGGPVGVESLRDTLDDIAHTVKTCRQCFFVFDQQESPKTTLSEVEGLCHLCKDSKRDKTTLAVVEKETDLITIEKTRRFNGLYYVLGGTISPLRERAAGEIRTKELLERVKLGAFQEVILALSPTTAGEYTTQELERLLKPFRIKITRLGRGLPRGAEVEFADEDTLSSALEGRK